MLETNEVDEDLFTPAPGTSLANIFNNDEIDLNEGNSTLQYVPQIPTQVLVQTSNNTADISKTSTSTECVFATSISAYEWVDNKYNHREHLGIALIKSIKDKTHSLIIYTSGKITLSLAIISPSFHVDVKKDVSISYYDNSKKYWLICAAAKKIQDLVSHLANLKVNIKYLTHHEKSLVIDKTLSKQQLSESLECDTDSSKDRRDKDSIIRRMATMGQSVLPIHKNIPVQSTDSSDIDDYHRPPLPRHKPTKSISKKEKKETTGISDLRINHTEREDLHRIQENNTVISNVDNVIKYDTNLNDLSSFISEQRLNNSELRINVNRLTEKVDNILGRTSIKDAGVQQTTQQSEIVYKLLKEYEIKILTYEQFIKSKGFDCNLLLASDIISRSSETPESNNLEGNQSSKEDTKIEQLETKIQDLTDTLSQTIDKYKQYETSLLNDITVLNQDLQSKTEILHDISTNTQMLINKSFNKEDYSIKLKSIMNNTYQIISNKFDDEANYTGGDVKSIVGKIIKKTTIDSLHDVDNEIK